MLIIMMKIFFILFFVHVLFIDQVISVTYFCDHSASCGCSYNDAILNKIVGGEPVLTSSWGWMVSLRDVTNQHICGGAIISPLYIVTAAHCVPNSTVSNFDRSIAVGMNQLNEAETIGQVRKVVQIISHPNYDPRTKANDIAVLRLNASLELSSSKSTACLCLPQFKETENVEIYPPKSSSLIAVGWGVLLSGSYYISNQLQQVTVNEVPADDITCSSTIYNAQLQFCAGVNGGGKDTCQGDSGGPLMYFENTSRQWVLAGLTSYGVGCGEPSHAGVYTRVSAYVDWLRKIIDRDDCGEKETSGTTSAEYTTTVSSSTSSMNNTVPMNIAAYSVTFSLLLLLLSCGFSNDA